MALITLSGSERELKFTFKSLRALEDYYKQPIAKVFEDKDRQESLENLTVFLWSCLRNKDRSLTFDNVEDLLDESLENGDITFNDLSVKITEALNESVIVKQAKGNAAKN